MSTALARQSALTRSEGAKLAELEATIERGLATFVEVGTALATIRKSRLYRDDYATFEKYCDERWSFGKRQADRLIASAEIIGSLGPIGPIPAAESQVRPLVSLEPDEQRQAWGRANEIAADEGVPVRARHVEEAVQERKLRAKPVPEPSGEVVAGAHIKWWKAELATITDVVPETLTNVERKALALLWTETIEPMIRQLEKLNPKARGSK